MSVRVQVSLNGVHTRIERFTDRAQYILANQVLADSNNYVPELSGDLKRYAIVSNDNKNILWTQPYARRQYYGNFKNYTKPGTGPKWDEKAKSNHLSSWVRILRGEF